MSWHAEVLEQQVMEASSCYVLLSGRGQGNTSGRSHGQQGTRGKEGLSVANMQARTALCVLPWLRPALTGHPAVCEALVPVWY